MTSEIKPFSQKSQQLEFQDSQMVLTFEGPLRKISIFMKNTDFKIFQILIVNALFNAMTFTKYGFLLNDY